MALHKRRQPFVLRRTDGASEALIFHLVPPEAVDAERLDVDALLVEVGDALLELPQVANALLLVRRSFHRLHDRHGAVGVHVDDADALAGDADLPARGRLRGETASHGVRAGGGAGDGLEQVSAGAHMSPPDRVMT